MPPTVAEAGGYRRRPESWMLGTPKHGWDGLPASVQAAVAAHANAEVVADTPQQGGFTPGVATRVEFADGSRAFVKAVAASQNADSADLHRREAAVVRRIGPDPAVAGLLECLDDGDWVTLVFEDVAGQHPRLPWSRSQFAAVTRSLQGVHDRFTPAPAGLPPLAAHGDYTFGRWQAFAADPQRAARHGLTERDLAALIDAESGLAAAVAGDSLLHGDLRADQILLRGSRVVFVDWPHACTGPAWADLVLMLSSMLVGGDAFGIDDVIGLSADLRDAPRRHVLALLAAMAGHLVWQSDEPPPPGLPTVRDYQRAQAQAVLPWLLGTKRSEERG